jgi:hypothetical protein
VSLVRALRRVALPLLLLLVSGCLIFQVGSVSTDDIEDPRAAQQIGSPVKAHLLDGSTVVYRRGVTVAGDTLYGQGVRYDLGLASLGRVGPVPVDSVGAMEAFRDDFNVPASAILTAGAAGVAVVGSLALFKALFGSCPTIYADVDGELVLQAEAFSYSIVPLFESRDVDLVRVVPGATGTIALEIRNEALETHYLNHLELVEVEHRDGERVAPDPSGQALALRDLRPPSIATDAAGRDVVGLLGSTDGVVFETAASTLARAATADAPLYDHIDLVIPAASADSAALFLNLRNSLLTTVLFYEVMLADAGARSLDWLGSDLARIGPAIDLGRWFHERLGLRVLVEEDGEYREIGRVPESGPIAWKEVAIMVPVPAGDSVRVRLSFLADAWRIDQVALAAARRPAERLVALARIVDADGDPHAGALANLAQPDDRYLETRPGQRLTAEFHTSVTGGADAWGGEVGEHRSYMLAAQGYYTEWVRGDWLRSPRRESAFQPSDDALRDALTRWRARQPEFEEQFYGTAIPVR